MTKLPANPEERRRGLTLREGWLVKPPCLGRVRLETDVRARPGVVMRSPRRQECTRRPSTASILRLIEQRWNARCLPAAAAAIPYMLRSRVLLPSVSEMLVQSSHVGRPMSACRQTHTPGLRVRLPGAESTRTKSEWPGEARKKEDVKFGPGCCFHACSRKCRGW